MNIEPLLATYTTPTLARQARQNGDIDEETLQLLLLYLDEDVAPQHETRPEDGRLRPEELSEFDKIVHEYETLKAQDSKPRWEDFIFEGEKPADIDPGECDEQFLSREETASYRRERAYLRRAKRRFDIEIQAWSARMQSLETRKQVAIQKAVAHQKIDAARAATNAHIREQEELRKRIRETTGRTPASEHAPEGMSTVVTIPLTEYHEMKAKIVDLQRALHEAKQHASIQKDTVEQGQKRSFSNKRSVNCEICNSPFVALREHAKYCSPACAQRAHRLRLRESEAGAR